MLLGFTAAFIGMAYALLKFLTIIHLRRMKEDIVVAQHEVKKNHHHLERLHEKLAITQSKKRTLQRDNVEIHRVAQQLYVRLKTILPKAMHPQLEDCRLQHVPPRNRELKLLFQLDLVDQVARALEPFSLLLLHLPDADNTEQTLAVARLTQRLSAEELHFHGPEDGFISCFFARPAAALHHFRQFIQDLPPASAATVRGALHTGMEVTAEQSELKRLLARSLQQARQLLEQAPAGALLLNEEAFLDLEDPEAAQLFDPDERLYCIFWEPESSGEQPC